MLKKLMTRPQFRIDKEIQVMSSNTNLEAAIFWGEVLKQLKEPYSFAYYMALSRVVPIELTDRELVLAVPDENYHAWFLMKAWQIVTACSRAGRKLRLKLVIDPAQAYNVPEPFEGIPIINAYEFYPGEDQWHIFCPYCVEWRHHGAVEGHRVAHCTSPWHTPYKDTGYVLKYAGVLSKKEKRQFKPARHARSFLGDREQPLEGVWATMLHKLAESSSRSHRLISQARAVKLTKARFLIGAPSFDLHDAITGASDEIARVAAVVLGREVQIHIV
jgi:hypothetical protein